MREQVIDVSEARLAICGKLTKFSGLIPGLVQEAYLSLKRAKPLYRIGGFGGAARAVSDKVFGGNRREFTYAFSERAVPDCAVCRQLYASYRVAFKSMEYMGAVIEGKSTAPF